MWLTSPDAAKQYQVTFDGGYSSPWRPTTARSSPCAPGGGGGGGGGGDGDGSGFFYKYGCSCYLFHLESKTAWSYADRFTDPTAESENYLGLEQPEWLTNDRLLRLLPGFWMSGWTFKLGTGDSSTAAQWWYQFKDDQGYNYYPPIRRSARTAGGSRSPTAAIPMPRASSSRPACPGPRGWASRPTRTTTSATAPWSSPSCGAHWRRASWST